MDKLTVHLLDLLEGSLKWLYHLNANICPTWVTDVTEVTSTDHEHWAMKLTCSKDDCALLVRPSSGNVFSERSPIIKDLWCKFDVLSGR